MTKIKDKKDEGKVPDDDPSDDDDGGDEDDSDDSGDESDTPTIEILGSHAGTQTITNELCI